MIGRVWTDGQGHYVATISDIPGLALAELRRTRSELQIGGGYPYYILPTHEEAWAKIEELRADINSFMQGAQAPVSFI